MTNFSFVNTPELRALIERIRATSSQSLGVGEIMRLAVARTLSALEAEKITMEDLVQLWKPSIPAEEKDSTTTQTLQARIDDEQLQTLISYAQEQLGLQRIQRTYIIKLCLNYYHSELEKKTESNKNPTDDALLTQAARILLGLEGTEKYKRLRYFLLGVNEDR